MIFTLEAFLKVFAFTWAGYWKEAWNKFDFIVVVISYVGYPMILADVNPVGACAR